MLGKIFGEDWAARFLREVLFRDGLAEVPDKTTPPPLNSPPPRPPRGGGGTDGSEGAATGGAAKLAASP